MSTMIIISYDEKQGQDGYTFTKVMPEHGYPQYFGTGDFLTDINNAIDYSVKQSLDGQIMRASSVDDFFAADPQRYYLDGKEVKSYE